MQPRRGAGNDCVRRIVAGATAGCIILLADVLALYCSATRYEKWPGLIALTIGFILGAVLAMLWRWFEVILIFGWLIIVLAAVLLMPIFSRLLSDPSSIIMICSSLGLPATGSLIGWSVFRELGADRPKAQDNHSKELPLTLQLTALFALSAVWLVSIAYVIRREWKLQDQMRYYDYPFVIYQLLFVAIPLVLIGADMLFLLRARPVRELGLLNRSLCHLLGVVTCATVIVILTCGIWALSIPWEVIRE